MAITSATVALTFTARDMTRVLLGLL